MEKTKESYGTGVNEKTVVIPFGLAYNPMEKLAIINFEKQPDSVYVGLEPQYFDDDIYGRGYRIIGYRLDGYVDVYDDMNLNHINGETFDVAGKGLCERLSVRIENPIFEKNAGCVNISFKFIDKIGRTIDVRIVEKSSMNTKGMNLLAPIGSSTENPSHLPLFFLYEFDFIRKHKTVVELFIDGKKIKQDNFPVPLPKDFQRRYYSRYSTDCQIIEFANAKNHIIEECVLNSAGLVLQGPLEYQYSYGSLQKITLKHTKHPLFVEFGLGFPDIRSLNESTKYVDTFKVTVDEVMGYVSGEYSITSKEDTITIELIPSSGWTPVPNSLLTKILFGKKSIFCSWPKTYKYIQNIDLITLHSDSYWVRIK